MRRKRRAWRRITGLGALVVCFLVFTGCEAVWTVLRDDRRPDRYLIPEGFVGWVRIDYEVEGASELQVKDGFNVYRIPPSGHFKTSSKLEEGWASDEYYYVDARENRQRIRGTAPNKGGLIWRGVIGGVEKPGRKDLTFSQFFVGPEALAKEQPSRGEDGEPHYGPVSASGSEAALELGWPIEN